MLVATSPSGFLIVPPLATLVFKLFVVGDTPGLKPGGWGAGTGRGVLILELELGLFCVDIEWHL